jgi:CheY-specific phosphatase CheX
VTELMNIVYGQAKLVLDVKNAGIQSNIPSLVIGKRIPADTKDPRLIKSKALLETGKIVVIPFETSVGSFYVQVCFTEQFAKELSHR